jgi:hypothetical protein
MKIIYYLIKFYFIAQIYIILYIERKHYMWKENILNNIFNN